jgi:hypothetical protein
MYHEIENENSETLRIESYQATEQSNRNKRCKKVRIQICCSNCCHWRTVGRRIDVGGNTTGLIGLIDSATACRFS